jgi:hypothetical protein
MPLINAPVSGYSVSVLMTSRENDAERQIQLNLEGVDLLAELIFVQMQPEEWIVFSDTRVTVTLPLRFFDDMYHLLQTEGPLGFLARAEEDPQFLFARLSTFFEPVGEGPIDAGEGP